MALSLEVFATDPMAAPDRIVLDQIAFAREQLSSYENGYRAGWEEASATRTALAALSKNDLSQHLQKLSFTYHEAQAHVLAALHPLLLQVVGQIMPQIAREALAPMVVEMLIPLADRLGQAPVILRVNPAAQEALLSAIEANTSLPIQIIPDPTLGEGQVHLQLGTAEAELDLDKATADIATAVRGFFDLFVKDHLHV
jgi:flagellar assembly protein FliH